MPGTHCARYIQATGHNLGLTNRESLMQTLASSVRGVVDERRQIHTDYQSPVEKKGWHSHSLKGRAPQPLPGQAFIGFLIRYIKEGFHSLCSSLLSVITFYR